MKYCCVLLNSFNAEYYLWSQYRVVYTRESASHKRKSWCRHHHTYRQGRKWVKQRKISKSSCCRLKLAAFLFSLTLTHNPRKHRMNREQRQQHQQQQSGAEVEKSRRDFGDEWREAEKKMRDKRQFIDLFTNTLLYVVHKKSLCFTFQTFQFPALSIV